MCSFYLYRTLKSKDYLNKVVSGLSRFYLTGWSKSAAIERTPLNTRRKPLNTERTPLNTRRNTCKHRENTSKHRKKYL